MKTTSLKDILPLCALLALAACGDDREEPGTVEEEGCEHMKEGPTVPVTAVATGDGPTVSEEHTRYDVTLVDVGGGQLGGAVRYEAAEAGPYLLFLDRDVPVTITGASGAVSTTEGGPIQACADLIPVHHDLELGVGTYTLQFGPTDEGTVRLVIEHGGEDHGHE